MASASLFQFPSFKRVLTKEIAVCFTIGAAGAPTLSTTIGNTGLVTSVARSSAGVWLVTLKDTFPALINAQLTLGGVLPVTSTPAALFVYLGTISPTAGTVQVKSAVLAGTATDLPSGTVVYLNLQFAATSKIG